MQVPDALDDFPTSWRTHNFSRPFAGVPSEIDRSNPHTVVTLVDRTFALAPATTHEIPFLNRTMQQEALEALRRIIEVAHELSQVAVTNPT